ncbi:substrate-binding domain-containing protein [Paracoccus methylarcula]|uniref:LacI family DNA-binding transcriptional regulator n=1 Tax=Paracoccus methylarcula TaxID=72022 RepID=A0A3R7NZ74_9RHOB|nr:substrate-binding domain-containing protein [Paracoccus methylarcula]RNF35908.1 LacI family DNA-binding transcriptional regulator [Paracoccus methylarcula]
MRKPTIIDLAKAAGVSPTTISHAFSGRRKVDPATRERIIALAEEMGYRPNQAAQRLRSGRTGTIALASSMPFAVAAGASRFGFLMEIAASAAMTALTRNMALCLVPPLAPGSNLDSLALDGVIVVEPTRDDPLISHFEARYTPIVSIGKVPGRDDIPAVDLRSAQTALLLLDHLHQAGSRRIGLITGERRRTSYEETEAAYAGFAAGHGMQPVTLRLDESGGEGLAETETARLLRDHKELDGLLVTVDAFATGALTALAGLGRRVPQDIRLATRYDGLRARLAQPPLTAVDLHLDKIASIAVEMIFARIEGRDSLIDAPEVTLLARQSSG